MSGILPLAFEGEAVRMIWRDNHPWFIASDVAKILGYRDAANMVRRLETDEKGTRSVSTLGGEQALTIISEPGLYRAIFGSRIPAAMRFKWWVFHEVLPNLRHNGRYVMRGRRPSRDEIGQMNRQAHAAGMKAYADTFEAERNRLMAALGCADLIITLPATTPKALDHQG